MKADSVNRWLTLGANLGVLIGIILLLVELDQNATMMEAQIWNERTSQGIGLFMSIAESRDLSEIDGLLRDSGFPEDTAAISELNSTQKRQFYWFIRAQRFRAENMLAQQRLGLINIDDPGPLAAGRGVVRWGEALGEEDFTRRIKDLIAEVENMND